MSFSPTMVAALVALLVSLSATYNAYMLRGGKLAWSQVLTTLATVCLTLSIVFTQTGVVLPLVGNVKILSASPSDILYIIGFLLLFAASLKLRYSLK